MAQTRSGCPSGVRALSLRRAPCSSGRRFVSMTSTYKFNVVMTCSGCSGAIDRVLKKTEGVSSYDISLERQEVLVHASSISYDDVLAKIKKTGKEVKSGEVVSSA